jgi:hypothetical protein
LRLYSPARFLPRSYFFNMLCGNHMGTKFWKVVFNEHGIGGSGESCGDIDAHLGRIKLYYHGVLGGKYVPRAMFFDLKLGVIGAVTLSRRSASSSARATS